jgi:hypothetical protein
MKIEQTLNLAGSLSDLQELIQRNERKAATALINSIKTELFKIAWQDANSGLSFEDWAKLNGHFFSAGSN